MFEKTVKQNLSQSPEGAERQTTRGYSVYSVLLVLTRGRHLSLCQHHIGWISQIFLPSLSFSAVVRGVPLWTRLWTSFTVPETRVFRAADGENFV